MLTFRTALRNVFISYRFYFARDDPVACVFGVQFVYLCILGLCFVRVIFSSPRCVACSFEVTRCLLPTLRVEPAAYLSTLIPNPRPFVEPRVTSHTRTLHVTHQGNPGIGVKNVFT
jgi:hypothetical protein